MILVVGATGNIGNEVVRLLRAKGVATRVLVRDKAKATSMFGEDVEVVEGDLRDPASLPVALEGVNKVF
ncbi:MAG TPA: nucleoside-diphosphate sugar epimerase, partial [Gammaproteobacteria bacterium]|nr:nucleoside-diphosphate sugar epimerase [Gammaproteobacteria bacterium]